MLVNARIVHEFLNNKSKEKDQAHLLPTLNVANGEEIEQFVGEVRGRI